MQAVISHGIIYNTSSSFSALIQTWGNWEPRQMMKRSHGKNVARGMGAAKLPNYLRQFDSKKVPVSASLE
jgi:hypothetical protein